MVDWSSYAHVYDLMAENNPAYQEVVDLVLEAVRDLGLPAEFEAADIGAGTGNFSLAVATAHPGATVTHLDADPQMNRLAEQKARAQGLTNLTFRSAPARAEAFPAASLDLIITVHALYALPEPHALLRAMHCWLRPGGHMVAVNLGRVLDVGDWARFLFRDVARRRGHLGAVGLFLRGREVARQNRLIARRQAAGTYWTHSSEGFSAALRAAGFAVTHSRPVYRGYSDLAVCRATDPSVKEVPTNEGIHVHQ